MFEVRSNRRVGAYGTRDLVGHQKVGYCCWVPNKSYFGTLKEMATNLRKVNYQYPTAHDQCHDQQRGAEMVPNITL